MARICCVLLCVLALFSGAAQAAGLAVVDVERVFRESAPGKDGEAHLKQVRDILQKGLDELRGLYKGKEETAEAKAALRDGQAALERQFAADRRAVRQVLSATLDKVIRTWFDVNGKILAISAVAPTSAFFVYSPSLNVTDAVIREMDKEKPAFQALPTVTVQANPAANPKARPPGKSAVPPARPSGQPRTQ